MESFEAMRMVVGGDAVKVAKRLHRSSSLIHKWCEPHVDFSDAGTMNPLDRLEIVIEAALGGNRPVSEALAPVFWLAQRFDCLVLPPERRPDLDQREYLAKLCAMVKECGEVFSTAAGAMRDGKLSTNERRLLGRELHEAMVTMAAFARMVEGGL